MKSGSPMIGIDLGTSKLAASIWREDVAAPEVVFRARGDQGTVESTLRALPRLLEGALGQAPTRAVVTVPSAMKSNSRAMLPGLLEDAGLSIERVLNTSTASILAAGLLTRIQGRLIAIDLGAHTADVCVIDVGEGVYEVLSKHGDARVGGTHLDQRLLDWMKRDLRRSSGVDLDKDPSSFRPLLAAVERGRIKLSSDMEAKIHLRASALRRTAPLDLYVDVSRSRLEEISGDVLEILRGLCDRALNSARLSPADIQGVLMVGGLTGMPRVRQLAAGLFPSATIHDGLSAEDAPVLGAAVLGGVLQGHVRDVLLLDVSATTLGVQTSGGEMTPLIAQNTTIPTSKRETFKLAKDGLRRVAIHVLAGESPLARDNLKLATLDLKDLTSDPQASTNLDIEFQIDAKGWLTVTATDRASQISKQSPPIDILLFPTNTGMVGDIPGHDDWADVAISVDDIEPTGKPPSGRVEEAFDLLRPILDTFDRLRASKKPSKQTEIKAFQDGIELLREQVQAVTKQLRDGKGSVTPPAAATGLHGEAVKALSDCARYLCQPKPDDGDPLRRAQIAHEVILHWLEDQGVTVIRPKAKDPLDPKQHNVVTEEVALDIPAGRITRCLGYGFRIGTRVLQVAKVAVQPNRPGG